MTEGPTSGIAYLADESTALRSFSAVKRAQLIREEIRDFPQPDPNAVIWKYLETRKFEYLLQEKALYLCQVAKLAREEPNEGVMNKFQETAMRKYFASTPEQFENCFHFYESMRQRAWVTCFSLGGVEKADMWREYCKQPPNEGVAIRTTYRRLRNSLGQLVSLANPYPSIAQVRYSESEDLVWKLGYLLYQKLPKFSDECEVRVCAFSPQQQFAERTCMIESVPLPVRLMSLVRHIYVHPRATGDYFDKICDLIAKHLPERQGRVCWSQLRGRL